MRRSWLAVAMLVGTLALIGCGDMDDDDGEVAEPMQQEPGVQQEPGDAGDLSREDVRAARAAIREIPAQASGAARIPETVTDMDLLPSEEGAEFLFSEGYIDRRAFCEATATVAGIDAYGTLDGELIEADNAVAGERFAATFNQVVHDGIDDMGETMYNALSVACLDL